MNFCIYSYKDFRAIADQLLTSTVNYILINKWSLTIIFFGNFSKGLIENKKVRFVYYNLQSDNICISNRHYLKPFKNTGTYTMWRNGDIPWTSYISIVLSTQKWSFISSHVLVVSETSGSVCFHSDCDLIAVICFAQTAKRNVFMLERNRL